LFAGNIDIFLTKIDSSYNQIDFLKLSNCDIIVL